MTTTPRWLGTRQAADLLGVKPETVYAYVSRGVLERHRAPDGRSSRFSRVEVERLAARNRRGGRAGALEVVIDSGLTLLDPEGGLFYRGTDATELARTSTFERVAELLWGSTYRTSAWTVPEAVTDVARKAVAALPAPARPTDRLRVAVAALAALAGADDHRDDRRPEYVTRAARTAILAGVEALPRRSTPQGTTVAHRLWSRLSGRPPERGEIRALTGALVLLADHELAASTLAARVAASVWADPYLVLLTGLSAGGGLLHAGAVSQVETLLRNADAPTLVAEWLRRGERIPGFGHKVYVGTDPRAETLLALLARAGRRSEVDDVVARVLAQVERLGGPAPNSDFALGAFVVKAGLEEGAGEAIFLIARMAGVVAHAMEEYPHRARFRPRALYTGPAPRS